MKRFEVKESETAFGGFTKVYTVDGKLKIDPESFMEGARENLTEVLRNNRKTKVKLYLSCYFKDEKRNVIIKFGFYSHNEVNLEGSDEDDIYFVMTDTILEKIARFVKGDEGGGSEWTFSKVDQLKLYTVSYNPLRGETWIPLPKELANKKAIINMQNKDNKCFLWSVLRALNPTNNHPERIDKKLKLKENTLNMEGIEYPVSLKNIDKFEKQNQSICIIVFGYDWKSVYPLRNSNNVDREHKIRLMLIEENGVNHYCLIKNISALLSSQISKHKCKTYFCDRCLNPFNCEEYLNKHLEYCGKHKAVKIKMPSKGSILKFKTYHRRERVPFVIYLDTESLTEKIQSCEPNPEISYTKKYQKHRIFGFSYFIKCFDDSVYKPVLRTYTGPNASKILVEWLEKDAKIIANIPKKDIIFGKEEREHYNKETKCWICEEFNDDI